MSRYGFKVDDVEIVVGWDNPTHTFFGQAEVDGKEIVNTMLGLGQFDVQSVLLLESMIRYTIPTNICTKLMHDRDTASTRTPLQETVGKIFEENNQ